MHGRKNPKSGESRPPTPPAEHAPSGQTANAGGSERPNQGPPAESRRTGSRPAGSRPEAADARACAYAVVRRVFEEGAYADRALHAEAEGLAPRDRGLATRLAYGVVQRKATLDHVIQTLARRPTAKLEPAVLAALRLGVFQLAFMDRVPAHAAVGETVELAKRHSRRGAGLVNAVLRRAVKEARPMIDGLPDRTPAEAALRHSHPIWIAELWFDQLGAGAARALMAANNEPAEAAIRANTLKTTAAALAAQLPAEPADLPDALLLTSPFDAFASPLWHEGLFMPQSRAAQAVSRALDPQPGERVLDLCAAPGAKTTHLAALMGNRGEVTAVERHPGRAEALVRTAARMGAENVTVRVRDAAQPVEDTYDRILVDPPCSDLGTLASRPDARWRKEPHNVDELAALQARILDSAAAALAPGGTMVYSTCTISPRENEGQIEAFLGRHADFQLADMPSDVPVWDHPTVPRVRQTLPHRDRTDGFFIARMRRT